MINSITLSGHLGAAPVFHTYDSGARFVRFSIANNQPKVNGKPVEPLWLECEAWNEVRDRIEKCNLRAGKLITVTGYAVPSVYETTANGKKTKHKVIKCKLINFVVATPRSESDTSETEMQSDAPQMHLVNESSTDSSEKRKYSRKAAV